ncbi:MAG: anti-sigma factor [Candidatus Beckwithbacteria bacterium]|nr:anti-sigma factor [Candidatus Beckwithbacteria bacterium]
MLKKIILGLLAVLLIVGGIAVIKRNRKVEEKISPEITLESSKMITDQTKLKPEMTEAEKQAIENAFKEKGAEMTMLRDVEGGQTVGTAWRQFDKKFYFKIEASRLPALEKGFYYEGWLVGESGFFSVGRMDAGTGKLYYISDQDKSQFKGVVVTWEPEDGNPVPDKHILEGNF